MATATTKTTKQIKSRGTHQKAAFENQSLKMRAVDAMLAIRPFVAKSQLSALADAMRGEEKEFFIRRMLDLAHQLTTMPKTYETDGQGDAAMVQLHYFAGGCDWYIIERDSEPDQLQAFGFAILNGDIECAELGYISIEELTACGAELDLHFTTCTLPSLKSNWGGNRRHKGA